MPGLHKDVDILEQSMRLFFQAMKRQQTWDAAISKAGVSIDRPAAFILKILLAHGSREWSVHDLAAELGVEAPTVTRKTQELEEAGYIKRSRDVTDRRITRLSLTASGKKVISRLLKAQREQIAAILHKWPAADRRQFVELFNRFSNDLHKNI